MYVYIYIYIYIHIYIYIYIHIYIYSQHIRAYALSSLEIIIRDRVPRRPHPRKTSAEIPSVHVSEVYIYIYINSNNSYYTNSSNSYSINSSNTSYFTNGEPARQVRTQDDRA